MSFSVYLGQVFGKRAVWLYRVSIPGGTTYYVTSKGSDYQSSAGKPDVSFASARTWVSTPILNGGITQTAKSEKAEVAINLPTSGAMAQEILAYDDQDDVTVAIWQTFNGDPDEEYAVKFVGRVVKVQPGLIATSLVCEEGFTTMARSSVAQVMQRLCRHAHYFTTSDGGGCRLNVDDWKQSVSLTSATGKEVTSADFILQPDGTYTAGILFVDGVEYFIQSHVGQTLTLERPLSSGAFPRSAQVAPGCNLTPANCLTFSNIANFGGFWFMTETPFDGRALG